VHSNRIVKSFRERGIALFRNGEVSIQDFAQLRRLADPLMDAYERTTAQYGLPGTEKT
jgi:hypothetical protein